MDRPAFLDRHYDNGAALVAAFEETSFANRMAADQWIMWAQAFGSMTWQEDCLKAHLDNLEEI